MAKQSINIGSSANDGTGTPLRDAFDICNDNFTEIYAVNGGSAAFPSLGSAGQVLQVNSGGSALEFAAGSSVSDLNDLSDVVVNNTDENAYFINIPASRSGDLGNLGIGKDSLNSLTSGDYNTAIGDSTLNNLTTSEGATAIGFNAGAASGTNLMAGTTLIGRMAGFGRSGYRNVAIGDSPMGFGSGKTGVNKNTAIGYHTLYRIDTNGVNNIAIGHEASQFLTTAEANIAIGDNAARSSTADGHISIGYEAGYSNTSGTENTNIGYQTGYTNSTSGSNTNVGHQAAYYATGQQLAAFGYRALFGSSGASSGSYNSAFGREAGVAVTSGSQNTLLGAAAGKAITTGANNTVIGSFAAFNSLIDGDNNIVIGKEAAPSATGVDNEITLGNASITALRIPGLQSGASDGDVLTFASGTGLITLQAAGGGGVSGKVEGTNFTDSIIVGHTTTGTLSSALRNTALGLDSMDAITSGDDNTFIGYKTGTAITTGAFNVGIGSEALKSEDVGGRNVAVGAYALTTLNGETAGHNIGIGYETGIVLSNGQYNVLVGSYAGDSLTTADRNIAIGHEAATSANNAVADLIAIGYQAAHSAAAGSNTHIGRESGRSNSGNGRIDIGLKAGYSNTSGGYNTNIGYFASYANTSNGFRTVVGGQAGYYNTGANNVFIGYQAGYGSSGASTADRSVVIGSEAGEALTSGALNVFIGYQAGEAMTSGGSNVAIGSEALKTEDSRSFSVAVGTSALTAQNAGAHAYNTGLGHNAGNTITTGVQNTCVGGKAGADNSLITGSNNIVIGYDSQPSADDVSNEITLGDANITAFRCADQSIAALSDARDKTNIKDSNFGLDFIDSIRPVEFEWDFRPENMAEAKQGKKRVGFIAQELQEAMPNGENEILDLVYEINEDRIEAKYGNLIPILVKAVQELKAEIELLKLQK